MAAGNSGGDWKHSSGPAKPSNTPAASGTSRKSWQPGAAKPAGPAKPRSRGSKFLITGCFAAVLIGAIVAVILLWKPAKFPELVLVAPAPGDSLAMPANGPGTQSVGALGDWAKAGSDRPKLAASPDELANPDTWKQKIDNSSAATVLYFAAAGGADPEGPFLWFVPPDASAPKEGDKIRVKDILARLGGLKASQPKLLVFDLARMPVSWAHGNYFPDFARALKELDAEIAKVDNLVVICSCDADETAWSSEELRETAFGYFFRQGITGNAGTAPGDRITAQKLYDYAKEQTSKWASVNRDEKQTPMLLPTSGGTDRAAKLELATVPNTKPTVPAPVEPEKVPAGLDELWKKAETLSTRTPAPDTTDPAKWREFLETLIRWEQAFRFGRNTSNLQAKAQALGEQLSVTSGGVEPLCIGLGLKIGPALGFPVPAPSNDFRTLWNPPPGSTRAEEFDKLPNRTKSSFRLALAAQILEEVGKTGSPEDLKTADELLSLIDGSQVGTTETHFVRMLAKHMDSTKRPPVRLVQEAIKLARTAEEAALSAAYSEQVARWITKDIDAGDTNRRIAEDCLFASDDATYADLLGYSNTAAKSYKTARETADTVMTALALRDYAFARLPYYGRWIAGYRGTLPPEDVKNLLKNAEEAARYAHDISEIALNVPSEPKDALTQLRDKTASLKSNLTALESAYTAEAAKLSNTVSQQNWHTIDGILSVPFLKAADRSKLFGFLRSISYTLSQQQQQPTATGVPPLSPQESASRALRIGKAILNENSPQTQALLEQPNPSAWWLSFRQVADTLGKGYRALPGEMKQLIEQAASKPITEAPPLLAKASYKARLADPAAPCMLAEAPTAIEQRYWQHKLLLNQARRTTGDGWADVGPGPPDTWYCRKAAAIYIASARTLVGGSAPLSPPEEARRYMECNAEATRLPTVLTLVAADAKEIADEPSWKFPFSVVRQKNTIVGFPIYWLTEPGEPYHAPSKTPLTRTRETAFFKAGVDSVPMSRDFTAPAKLVEKAEPGKLVTTVLYRGHLYEKPTQLVLAGTPSLDIHQAPASGDAKFAVLSDPDTVAGAVTILIDQTLSMKTVIALNKTRMQEALLGVGKLVKELPRGTTLTIGRFYGNDDFTKIVREVVQSQIKLDGTDEQYNQIMAAVNRVEAIGESTPLAGAIREVLSADNKQKFWPEKFTGTRTLIVVTDGEDNWAQKGAKNYYRPQETPDEIVIGALRDSADDVSLHIVFFGMLNVADNAEQKRAYEQFKPIELSEHFRKTNRTPAKLYQDVKNSEDLTSSLRGSMLPTIPFTEQNQREKAGEHRVPVTLAGELIYRLSPPLSNTNYFLWAGGTVPQQLQLDPGDRVLLQTKLTKEGKIALEIPPIAFNISKRPDFAGIPKATSRVTGNRTPLHMTLPDFDLKTRTGTCDLNFIATLETNDGAGEKARLYRQPPLFAWFDANYADGQPANAKKPPIIRIDNRPGLLAPAWTLQLKQWDADRGRDQIRKPVIDGHWIERFPANGVPIPVDMRNVQSAKEKLPPSSDVQGIDVKIESIGIETWEDGTLHPQGQYLVVRLKYPNAAGKVLLRPGKLGGTNQAANLHERHTYYDAVGRYTARFGPISNEDMNTSTDLMLYSVETLRKEAADTSRAVSVTFPDRPMNPYALPDFLQPK
jgi:hypothetical protein